MEGAFTVEDFGDSRFSVYLLDETTGIFLHSAFATGGGVVGETHTAGPYSGTLLAGHVYKVYVQYELQTRSPAGATSATGWFAFGLDAPAEPPCLFTLEGDVNGDGIVDITDLGIVLANFGMSCP